MMLMSSLLLQQQRRHQPIDSVEIALIAAWNLGKWRIAKSTCRRSRPASRPSQVQGSQKKTVSAQHGSKLFYPPYGQGKVMNAWGMWSREHRGKRLGVGDTFEGFSQASLNLREEGVNLRAEIKWLQATSSPEGQVR